MTRSPRSGRPLPQRPAGDRRRWRAGALAATCAAASLAGACGRSDLAGPDDSDPPAVPGAPAVVARVIDGDTIEVHIAGTTEAVRLIGIDTPEKTGGLRPAECYGDEASSRAAQLLPVGSAVSLLRDVEARDRYDRLLAYVFRPDGLFVNLDLVRSGYAAAFPYEPNTTYSTELGRAEAQARRDALGLWGRCGGPDRVLSG